MDDRYCEFIAAWADACRTRELGVTGTCAEAVNGMVALFTELKAVRGHARLLTPNLPDYERKDWPHWWCVTEAGEIVDPTRSQFPGDIEYVPLDESKGEPTGRCPNCGDVCYDFSYLCSEKCEQEYAAYCGGSSART